MAHLNNATTGKVNLPCINQTSTKRVHAGSAALTCWKMFGQDSGFFCSSMEEGSSQEYSAAVHLILFLPPLLSLLPASA